MADHGIFGTTLKCQLTKKEKKNGKPSFERAKEGGKGRFRAVLFCPPSYFTGKDHPDHKGSHYVIYCETWHHSVMDTLEPLDSGAEIEILGDLTWESVILDDGGIWKKPTFDVEAVLSPAEAAEPEPSPVVSEGDDGLPF